MSRNVFMDFTDDREVTFKVRDHVFRVYSDVPLPALAHVSWAGVEGEDISRADLYKNILDGVCLCMPEEDAKRFRDLAMNNGGEFIGVNGLLRIQSWLMEVMTSRPLEESTESSESSDDTGESSTDGQPAKE